MDDGLATWLTRAHQPVMGHLPRSGIELTGPRSSRRRAAEVRASKTSARESPEPRARASGARPLDAFDPNAGVVELDLVDVCWHVGVENACEGGELEGSVDADVPLSFTGFTVVAGPGDRS